MTTSRRIVAIVAALVVLAPACNSRLLRPPATILVDGGESNVTPALTTTQRAFPSVLLAFFPSGVAVHAGDSLRFDIRYNGEPHTVALGALVDDALRAVDRLGPNADVRAIEKLPEMRKIPAVLPGTVSDADPKVNASAAQRCFLDSGVPPNSVGGGAPACAGREQPAFDGTQSFYSSGFIPEGESFRMKLAGNIKPGTYSFMCLVHRSTMRGTVEVRPSQESRPNVRRVKLDGSNEQRVVTAAVTTAATDAVRRNGGPVLAGTGQPGQIRGFVSAFVPDVVHAHVGEAVTWQFFEMHSISFHPSRKARRGLIEQQRDGRVVLNLDAWRSVGSAGPPPSAFAYPPVTQKLSLDGGTWSGNGTFSSGVLRAVPPAMMTYTLSFSRPGTYAYECLVHHSMRGRVVVSG